MGPIGVRAEQGGRACDWQLLVRALGVCGLVVGQAFGVIPRRRAPLDEHACGRSGVGGGCYTLIRCGCSRWQTVRWRHRPVARASPAPLEVVATPFSDMVTVAC